MANGILVWPVLLAQAIYLRLRRRAIMAIALLGTGVILSYCWQYQVPPTGMGIPACYGIRLMGPYWSGFFWEAG